MTKLQAGIDCQVHAIGKTIRPFFADPVTFLATKFNNLKFEMLLQFESGKILKLRNNSWRYSTIQVRQW